MEALKRWRVGEGFRITDAPTSSSERDRKERLQAAQEEIGELQAKMYADDRWSVLAIFQGMDAAGKDGTIRAVFSEVDPAGCTVTSFKHPSPGELDHDFLWRHVHALPERGRIAVFNRSWYEEVLVVRVHPEILASQRVPGEGSWAERLQSIADFERHLARNGTLVLKFWLHVSREEQRRRFLSRLEEPEKIWKFSAGDVRERGHWGAYQEAAEAALLATSRPEAPWFCVPADDKAVLRMTVAEIVAAAMRGLDLRWPEVGDDRLDEIARMRRMLEEEE